MPLTAILFFSAASGSLCGIFYHISLQLCWISSLFFLICSILFPRPKIFGALITLFVFTAAIFFAVVQKEEQSKFLATLPKERCIFHGQLEELSRDLDGDRTGIISVDYFIEQGQSKSINMKLFVSFHNGSAALPLEEGNIVQVMGKIHPLQPAYLPGTFDAALFGFARNIHGSLSVKNSNEVIIWQQEEQSSYSWLHAVRNTIRERLAQLLLPREAAIVLAQLIGDTRLFDNEQKLLYRQIGAGHLLAVSGLQVSMFAYLFFLFLRSLLALCPFIGPRSYYQRTAAVLASIFVWFFVALCGAPPSAVRAGFMATAILCGFFLGRNVSAINAVGLAGLFSVLYWPSCVVDPSFLLSYAAILGLIAINSAVRVQEPVEEKPTPKSIRKAYVVSLVGASISASLMTLPLSAFLFGELAWVGIVANIVIVPIASFLQVPALFCATAAIIWQWSWPAAIASWLLSIIESLCEGIYTFSFGISPIDSPPGIIVFFLTAAFFTALCFAAHKHYRNMFITLALVIPLIFIPGASEPSGLKISVLPVGQGDSTLFQLPSGHTMIVDGGGQARSKYNPGETVVAPFLRRKGIKHIDIMVVSHPDPDHILGLFPLMENFSVGELWFSGHQNHPLMKSLIQAAQKKGTRVKNIQMLWGTHYFGDTKIEVLGPHSKSDHKLYEELGTNDNSLILKISYGKNSALWPGDIEKSGENYLLNEHSELQVDIVKAPHHGSKTSSTDAFVERTHPQHVIFCTGPLNQWKFPHQPVIKRWQGSGAQTWNTAEQGLITLWLTGTEVKVLPFRA